MRILLPPSGMGRRNGHFSFRGLYPEQFFSILSIDKGGLNRGTSDIISDIYHEWEDFSGRTLVRRLRVILTLKIRITWEMSKRST